MEKSAIAEELTCPVCLEFYKDPRLLPCHHSLCRSCLVALCSKKKNESDFELQCPSCRHLFQAMDEKHIECLPKNFTLASIVCKFQESLKGDKVIPCDLCEEDQKGRAVKKCLQCQFNYCKICLEQLHPKRGAMASHKLVHVIDVFGEKGQKVESRSACLSSVSHDRYVVTQKFDQLKSARYCLSCDAPCAEEGQDSTEENHGNHDTIEIERAFRRKKEEFECIISRLMDEDVDLEKGLAHISCVIDTIQKSVEEKKVELVRRFAEMAEEVEKRKNSAENKIEEEMNMRLTSLQSRMRELEDLKAKTRTKLAAFSDLSSLADKGAIIFLTKLKKLRNEIGPVTGDYKQRAIIGPECDSSLPIERSMNDIITNLIQDVCPFERSHKIDDPKMAQMDIASSNTIMAIKVTNVQKDGKISADSEWMAIDQVDHYDVSYSCDPEETTLRRNIAENRCRLTRLKWDSEYTITVTAYMPDGKTCFDSKVFKTDPKAKDQNMVDGERASPKVNMAIKVTNVQKDGTISADIEWVAIDQVDHYEVTYFCDLEETILRRNIAENRCRLTSLKWDSEYTITVTAYMLDWKTSFDLTVFKTDPNVKDTNPAIVDKSPKRMHMGIQVTNDQKGGTMSADVSWWTTQQAGQYEVSYHCSTDEIVVLKKIAKHGCRLTNLRWSSTYTIKVTTQKQDGSTVFDELNFNTDSEVKCYPMAVSEICNKKILVPDSFNEFTASNKITKGVDFHKVEQFSGVVFTPVLTEEKHFWTMNIELTTFEDGSIIDEFLDFGIVNYSDLGQCTGLTGNNAAYLCSISTSRKGNFHLKFETPSSIENRSYKLPLKLYQKAHFYYGFMYDKINSRFAVMDFLRQKILHIFNGVSFKSNHHPIFAVCPYHNEVKMRVKVKLDHMQCAKESISYWIRKIDAY
ncbi:hypothetical protein CHS0354_040507 [Potamilus streckersoni]|uniref:RING-type domain-containing protein n=1 Tax=Potamilus streckersoni TaxID=2493646 RepID=A0AAE0WGL3_9BIVA|nr:hypothetical protein CHS0354_040507 [Potamilus streckersoni]